MVCRAGIMLLCAIGASSMASCTRRTPPREYRLQGQVLAVRAERQEIVIRHGDIENFMPGMTMPFRVKEQRLLEAAAPGDIVDATLVVQDGDAWLSRVTRDRPARAAAGGRRDAAPNGAAARTGRRRARRGLHRSGRAHATDRVTARHALGTDLRLHAVPAADLLSRAGTAVQDRAAAPSRGTPQLGASSSCRCPSILPSTGRPCSRRTPGGASADPRIWRFVTGDTETVDRFGERFGLTVVRGAGRPEEFVHSMKTAVDRR